MTLRFANENMYLSFSEKSREWSMNWVWTASRVLFLPWKPWQYFAIIIIIIVMACLLSSLLWCACCQHYHHCYDVPCILVMTNISFQTAHFSPLLILLLLLVPLSIFLYEVIFFLSVHHLLLYYWPSSAELIFHHAQLSVVAPPYIVFCLL